MQGAIDGELLDQRMVQDLQTVFDAEEPGSFASLVADFVDTGEESLRLIEAAISSEDRDKARQVAHRLKGMSSQLGACALRDQSRALERELSDRPAPFLIDRVGIMRDILYRTAHAYHELMVHIAQG